MAESTGFEDGVWAVVTAHSQRLLVRIKEDRINEIIAEEAYEVRTENIPVQTPQAVRMSRQ